MLMEFLPARLDFWPYNIDDAKLEVLTMTLNSDIELSKVFDLYEMIENIGKPQVREPIRPIVQGERIDLKVAKNGGRRPKPPAAPIRD